jgi:hypothetical protein
MDPGLSIYEPPMLVSSDRDHKKVNDAVNRSGAPGTGQGPREREIPGEKPAVPPSSEGDPRTTRHV